MTSGLFWLIVVELTLRELLCSLSDVLYSCLSLQHWIVQFCKNTPTFLAGFVLCQSKVPLSLLQENSQSRQKRFGYQFPLFLFVVHGLSSQTLSLVVPNKQIWESLWSCQEPAKGTWWQGFHQRLLGELNWSSLHAACDSRETLVYLYLNGARIDCVIDHLVCGFK